MSEAAKAAIHSEYFLRSFSHRGEQVVRCSLTESELFFKNIVHISDRRMLVIERPWKV